MTTARQHHDDDSDEHRRHDDGSDERDDVRRDGGMEHLGQCSCGGWTRGARWADEPECEWNDTCLRCASEWGLPASRGDSDATHFIDGSASGSIGPSQAARAKTAPPQMAASGSGARRNGQLRPISLLDMESPPIMAARDRSRANRRPRRFATSRECSSVFGIAHSSRVPFSSAGGIGKGQMLCRNSMFAFKVPSCASSLGAEEERRFLTVSKQHQCTYTHRDHIVIRNNLGSSFGV